MTRHLGRGTRLEDIVPQAIYDAGWPVWVALLFLICYIINGLKG